MNRNGKSRVVAWSSLISGGLLITAAMAALPLVVPAFAHDHWISRSQLTDPVSRQWCCGDEDCAPVKVDGLREQHGAYLIAETGESIPSSRVLWRSEDGQWWRCRNLRNNSTRCLIGPPQGF